MRTSAADAFEEVVAFVVDKDERGEIDHVDLPDRFHPELSELDHFHVANVLLRQNRSRTTNAAEIETAVLVRVETRLKPCTQ